MDPPKCKADLVEELGFTTGFVGKQKLVREEVESGFPVGRRVTGSEAGFVARHVTPPRGMVANLKNQHERSEQIRKPKLAKLFANTGLADSLAAANSI